MKKIDLALHTLEDRSLVIETTMKRHEPSIDELRLKQQSDAIRLAATEVAIAGIRESFKSIDERHHEISAKLDKIPELTTALANFTDMCKGFVPRGEIAARNEAMDKRLDELSQSLREIRK